MSNSVFQQVIQECMSRKESVTKGWKCYTTITYTSHTVIVGIVTNSILLTANPVPSPRGGLWWAQPLKQSSKSHQIETWNTIYQWSFWQFLECQAPRRNAMPPTEYYLATVLCKPMTATPVRSKWVFSPILANCTGRNAPILYCESLPFSQLCEVIPIWHEMNLIWLNAILVRSLV